MRLRDRIDHMAHEHGGELTNATAREHMYQFQHDVDAPAFVAAVIADWGCEAETDNTGLVVAITLSEDVE